MNRKLSVPSVISLCLAAVILIGSIYLPWWGMTFTAPQYPEGLTVEVYPNKMEGPIEIINGLNHYIGMMVISEENFPELQYLPYVVGGMAALTLLVALARRKGLLYGLIGIFAVGGVLGLYDIKRWLTKLGTNLDPKAPIDIDPFVPPLLGSNKIANFVTDSYFSYGSMLIGIAFLLMLLPLWRDRKR